MPAARLSPAAAPVAGRGAAEPSLRIPVPARRSAGLRSLPAPPGSQPSRRATAAGSEAFPAVIPPPRRSGAVPCKGDGGRGIKSCPGGFGAERRVGSAPGLSPGASAGGV